MIAPSDPIINHRGALFDDCFDSIRTRHVLIISLRIYSVSIRRYIDLRDSPFRDWTPRVLLFVNKNSSSELCVLPSLCIEDRSNLSPTNEKRDQSSYRLLFKGVAL